MSQARLEKRVGPVKKCGRRLLKAHKHTFTKEGIDKSGKGNIEPCRESNVYGVAYSLGEAQFEALKEYEKGYGVFELTVVDENQVEEKVFTFIATESVLGLRPTPDYFEHYLIGMNENNFPEEYIDVLKQRAELKRA